MLDYHKERILIWGKTAPVLSERYMETVCTGGIMEDGRPVRLYPIPYRYLDGDQRFKNYQWIEAEIARDLRDPRPESRHIKNDTIVCHDAIPTTTDEWGKRAEYMFKFPGWQFASVEDLKERERADGTSIGIVEPKEIFKISAVERNPEEHAEFLAKFEGILVKNLADRSQGQLFENIYTVPELKRLPFINTRIFVDWRCHGANCKNHHTQVMDWGLIELQRKAGTDDAIRHLEEVTNPTTHAAKFFMGNLKSHPTAFTIVGLWYPKRAEARLF